MTRRQALRAARWVLLGLAGVWVLWVVVILDRTPADADNGSLLFDVVLGPTLVVGVATLVVVNWFRGREAG